MLLNREQMLAKADDVPVDVVDVPEWGDGAQVKVRDIGTAGRLKWAIATEKVTSGEDGPDPTALLVVLSAVGEDGKLLFDVQDTDWLCRSNGAVVERIANKTAELSGIFERAVEDAEKNSDATESGETRTESPQPSDAPSPSLAAV